MQRRLRLTGSKRFSQLYHEGSSMANNLLVVRVLPNGLDHSRFSFQVSKRIGNAVIRNRVRRRLREVVRLTPVKAGWDAVFIARRGAEKARYQQLKQATNNLLGRTHLLASPRPRSGASDSPTGLPPTAIGGPAPFAGDRPQ